MSQLKNQFMETKIYSIDEIKNLFLQELLNKTNGKISKISDHSVLNGMAYGFAKVFQKSMKDIALLESELFPEYAYGKYLDRIARRYGITARRQELGSSVYVKIVASPGSLYLKDNCVFISSEGMTFSLVDNFEVGNNGWGYALLKSDDVGTETNVGIGSISKMTGQPSGHIYLVNELPATGGIDKESDEDFLQRILQNFNNFSFETLNKLTAIFQKIYPNIIEVRKIGVNSLGQVVLSVVTSNGVDLTNEQLGILTDKSVPYLSLQDLYVVNGLQGGVVPILVQNIAKTYIDLDFRVQLDANINITKFKVACQKAVLDVLDFVSKDIVTVQWEDLFTAIRVQSGIKMLAEDYFFAGNYSTWTTQSPHTDIDIPATTIPRLRMFVIRDEYGAVLFNNDNEVVPYYYGSEYTNVFDQVNNLI